MRWPWALAAGRGLRLGRVAGELREGIEGNHLSVADGEGLLRMCDTAHRMGRRALGIDDTSD